MQRKLTEALSFSCCSFSSTTTINAQAFLDAKEKEESCCVRLLLFGDGCSAAAGIQFTSFFASLNVSS